MTAAQKKALEEFIELAIALLDVEDGDADLEPQGDGFEMNGDEFDGSEGAHDL